MSYFRFKKSHTSEKSYPVTTDTLSNIEHNHQIATNNELSNSEFSEEMLEPSGVVHSVPLKTKSKSNKLNFKFQMSHKRKLQEVEKEASKILPRSSPKKLDKPVDSDFEKVYRHDWNIYGEFEPHISKSYSDIPQVKEIATKILKNGDDFSNSLSKSSSDALYKLPPGKKCTRRPLFLKHAYSEENCIMQEYHTVPTTRPLKTETHKINYEPASKSISTVIANKNLKDSSIHSPYYSSLSIAAETTILESDTAILDAEKNIKDVRLYEVPTPKHPIKVKVFKENETSELHDEIIPEKFFEDDFFYESDCETAAATNLNLDLVTSVNQKCVDPTASGKTHITSSNAATLTAQKMSQKVADAEEYERPVKLDSFKNESYPNLSAFKNAGSSTKKFKENEISDLVMDEKLLNNFFEDIFFDDNECESAAATDYAISVNQDCVENQQSSKATGKKINISNAAELAAQKTLQVGNEEFRRADKLNSCKNRNYPNPSAFKNVGSSSTNLKENETGDIEMDEKFFEKFFEDSSFDGYDCETTESTANFFNPESAKIVNQGCGEEQTFSTAGGKNINISNAAILAAQKMLEAVSIEESERTPILDSSKKRNFSDTSVLKGADCSSKKIKNSLFDKNFELPKCTTPKSLNSENLISNKNIAMRKPRKSLGLRRSMP